MPAVKDEAIVLRHLDYSETSQVLLVLTREHGPRRLIAKGVKRSTSKKFAVGIDLLERGHVVFIPKLSGEAGLATLSEWWQGEAHLGLRSRLASWYAAQYAAEITAAMTEEGDPHPEVFDALAGVLESLGAGEASVLSDLVRYQCALVMAAGLWPDLTRCVMCDRAAPPGRAGYYAAVQGGLVCRACMPRATSPRLVKAAVLAALRDLDITADIAEAAFNLLNETIATAIGRQPLAARHIRR